MPSPETDGTEKRPRDNEHYNSVTPDKNLNALKSPGEVRILLAEDNVVSQQALRLMIQKLGYSVDIVDNGVLALEALGNSRYDLLLLDLQMPEMDGITAAKRILETYSEEERPLLIALTGSSSYEDEKECLNAGMDGFIAKPIRLPELKELLEKLVL